MRKGANLAKAAARLGAIAVVGGAISDGVLRLAVFSGKTGQPLKAGRIFAGNQLRGNSLRKAIKIIFAGVRKAPAVASVSIRSSPPKRSSQEPNHHSVLTFDPNEAQHGAKAIKKDYDFDPLKENPLVDDTSSVFEQGKAIPKRQTIQKDEDWPPRIVGTIGLGMLARNFALADPTGTQLSYSSGASFALRFGLRIHPVAFFANGIPANLWLRLRYQLAVGLKSEDKSSQTGQDFDTSLGEFMLDAGYAWKILTAKSSPVVDFGLGFGMLDFKIDWNTQTKMLPNWAYRFMFFGLGARYPFLSHLGAHLRFDYRLVFDAGEIEEDMQGIGDSSVGGIAIGLGLNGNFKNFVASLDYNYTYFFYSIGNLEARTQENRKYIAGGAADQVHGLMINFGYSY
ncbi:MAG: hypothetical protein V1754_06560 [Pseudomonadota bacterium]